MAGIPSVRGLGIKVLGLDSLQAECDSVADELRAAEDPAAMAAGEPIRDKWRDLVPILDGNYRDSLIVAHTDKGAAVGTRWLPQLARDDQPFIYSKVLEFGDESRAAHPSARPALAASKAQALDAAGEPIRSVIKGRKPKRKVPTT